jgi:phosphoglycolate phosphatase
MKEICEYTLKVINRELPDNVDMDKYIAIYREYYCKDGYKVSKLFNGISNFLQRLKKDDKQIAILTNRSVNTANQILKDLGIYHFFDVIISAETIDKRKPMPDGLFIIMKETNRTPNETIMIGDSIIDIDTAINANVDSCFVKYGYGNFTDEVEKKATFIIDNFS